MTDAKPATRALVGLVGLVVFAVGVVVSVGIVVRDNRWRIERNAAIVKEICDAARRQNDVLIRYGAILTTPIPIPPDSGPALATAITARNQAFADAAAFARAQAKDFSCLGETP